MIRFGAGGHQLLLLLLLLKLKVLVDGGKVLRALLEEDQLAALEDDGTGR